MAGHMLVVLVAVLTLSLVSGAIRLQSLPGALRPYLDVLAQAESPAEIEHIVTHLLDTFYRDAIFQSILSAAISAFVAGLLTSLFLAREILQPLQQFAHSSRRIASGRYNERLTVPASTELSVVAAHFNEMAEALERVEQQRVALLNNVAHELRTPLTGLEGYLEGLMDGLFSGDPETFAQMFQEVRRLHRLVDDLQALSLVEAGQFSLRLERFDLIPLVERVIAQLKPQATAQSSEIISEHHLSEILVYADPDRTAQVMLNLIGNAIRYTPEAGLIIVRVSAAGNMAQVEIRDNGLGIPAEALPYIFERFYRVDRSRSHTSGGTGIGLTIARHLAWAMGGNLTAASPGLGQGSLFTFTLPLAPPSLT